MKQRIRIFDRFVTQWVASFFSQKFRPFFEFVTVIGGPLPVGAIGAGMAVLGFSNENIQLVSAGAAIPLTLILGMLLKLSFERARPMTEYAAGMRLQTFSFPSGHTSGSTITYGLLAYFAFIEVAAPLSLVAAGLSTLLLIAVGISRVYLGAHFPSDVVAGWLLGSAVLFFVVIAVRPLL